MGLKPKSSRDKILIENEDQAQLNASQPEPNLGLDNSDSSPIPRIESIGVDGSQRFSDINQVEKPQNQSQEMSLDFNPKKDIQEKINNQEMLDQLKAAKAENSLLRKENRAQKEYIETILREQNEYHQTLSTIDTEMEQRSIKM